MKLVSSCRRQRIPFYGIMSKYFIISIFVITLAGCGKNPLLSVLPEVTPAESGGGGSGTTGLNTARAAYSKARTVAMTWAADVKWAFVEGENISADGSGDWWFTFESVSRGTDYIVRVNRDGTTSTQEDGSIYPIDFSCTYGWFSDSNIWINDIKAIEPGFITGAMSLPYGLYSPAGDEYIMFFLSTSSPSIFVVQLLPSYRVYKAG